MADGRCGAMIVEQKKKNLTSDFISEETKSKWRQQGYVYLYVA